MRFELNSEALHLIILFYVSWFEIKYSWNNLTKYSPFHPPIGHSITRKSPPDNLFILQPGRKVLRSNLTFRLISASTFRLNWSRVRFLLLICNKSSNSQRECQLLLLPERRHTNDSSHERPTSMCFVFGQPLNGIPRNSIRRWRFWAFEGRERNKPNDRRQLHLLLLAGWLCWFLCGLWSENKTFPFRNLCETLPSDSVAPRLLHQPK